MLSLQKWKIRSNNKSKKVFKSSEICNPLNNLSMIDLDKDKINFNFLKELNLKAHKMEKTK